MKKTIRSFLSLYILALTCAVPFYGFTQDRQGNIVEYFGKEKVNEISEGALKHVFTEGLLLPGSRFSFSSETTPDHSIFGRFMFEENYEAKEGKVEIVGDGKNVKWEKIKVTDKNEFNNNRMRGSRLFLSYESEIEETVLFEASGHTQLFINGLPYEGDHYDLGYALIPVKLKKGDNKFILNTGRFPRMRARIIDPSVSVQLTSRDMTLPDVFQDSDEELWGAIRVINSDSEWFEDGFIECKIGKEKVRTNISTITPLNVRKVNFRLPNPNGLDEKKVEGTVLLRNKKGKVLSETSISLRNRSIKKHHNRTFVSKVDGSVQYYAVAPSSNPELENPAMFLSVHGASVQATNQANAYKQKDWGHLVAPTNRRPFGFAWEDWGRLDALEVLDHSSKLFKTDPNRTYLTGHSMGGHGTWYLGATYPDKWAAIAPCAGYPERDSYVGGFRRRILSMSDEGLKRFGMTREQMLALLAPPKEPSQVDQIIDSLSKRAINPVKTLKLKRNYLHYGVFIYHGEKDDVVPTYLAQDMRKRLGEYHNDFSYYEYPGGKHWYGNISVDWPPLFEFFKARTKKQPKDLQKLEFFTASPGVSSKSNFVNIVQQNIPFEISSVDFSRENGLEMTTENVHHLELDIEKMGGAEVIKIDDQDIAIEGKSVINLENAGDTWSLTEKPSLKEKGPHRNGGFKDAFTNNMVFVFGTQGSEEENDWLYNKARYDAQTFYYRANGSVEIIKDTDFDPETYADRNVIVYGNKDNHAAWNTLLDHCPIQISNNSVSVGNKKLIGNNWGANFIYPRKDSDIASIGVISATGMVGFKAAFANHYFQNSTHFPDVKIFNQDILKGGINGYYCSGFFGNDWSVESGDFAWR
jgi:pimeloyl-ACP methyl ester carboxylesterase